MPTKKALDRFVNLADVLERVGDVPPNRVRMQPPPGRATEADVVRILDRENIPCELIEGTLVEKAMGAPEGNLGMELGWRLGAFVAKADLGLLLGADGTLRLMPGLVRIPDLSFISWKTLPSKVLPPEPIPDLVPDLCVEVLSPSNTKKEMALKLKDYFVAGVQVVWLIDPATRSVRVFHSPDAAVTLAETDTLDGGEVLPGFTLALGELFAHTPRATPKRRRGG